MKTKHLVAAVTLASIIGFASCKKNDASTKEEIATTTELSTDQAIADNLTEDANDVFLEAATEQNLTGETPATPFESMGILGCASVTVTPLQGFPKTIVINFGTGCTSSNNITRRGRITIQLSDSVRKPGSTAVLTFDGYYVNGFKKEGIITWTNNGTATTKGWQRKVENGKITSPTGKYWLHSSIKNVVQTAGWATPRNLLDDVYSITGSSTVTNAGGEKRTSTIKEPLTKKGNCENISKGSIEVAGPNHKALIDFGTGDCDNIATISIDGGTSITFTLR